jgi:hypothetical protein
MNKIFLLLLLINSNILHAELAGDFEKTKGPLACSVGQLKIKINEKAKERIVLFGSQLSWTLTLENKGESKEITDGGCTYDVSYEKKENELSVKTLRTKCPIVSENGVINESLNLNADKLTYSFEFVSQNKQRNSYSCNYLKKK